MIDVRLYAKRPAPDPRVPEEPLPALVLPSDQPEEPILEFVGYRTPPRRVGTVEGKR